MNRKGIILAGGSGTRGSARGSGLGAASILGSLGILAIILGNDGGGGDNNTTTTTTTATVP
jgi:hypothetical protein